MRDRRAADHVALRIVKTDIGKGIVDSDEPAHLLHPFFAVHAQVGKKAIGSDRRQILGGAFHQRGDVSTQGLVDLDDFFFLVLPNGRADHGIAQEIQHRNGDESNDQNHPEKAVADRIRQRAEATNDLAESAPPLSGIHDWLLFNPSPNRGSPLFPPGSCLFPGPGQLAGIADLVQDLLHSLIDRILSFRRRRGMESALFQDQLGRDSGLHPPPDPRAATAPFLATAAYTKRHRHSRRPPAAHT